MPAPPEIETTLNQAAFERACNELGLKRSVSVQLRRAARGQSTRGEAGPGYINLYVGLETQEMNRLPFVITQITRTLLHELRHQFQFETWSPAKWAEDDRYSYSIKPSEVDARDWADRRVSSYRDLVRVKRRQASRLSRLSSAEARARR
jgi:hypothetical protein